MAAKALLYLGETTARCIFGNANCQKTRFSIQTSWRHCRGFKRSRDTSKDPDAAVTDLMLGGTLSLRKLWKPLGFTIAFSGATIVAASIWEYERIRNYTHRVINLYHSETQRRLSRIGWRGEAEKWWRSLSDGQRVFAPICFVNVLVFLCWRIPKFNGTMLRYFCANPSSSTTCWPMLLSTFSHHSLIHLAANMYVLHSFSTVAVSSLGKEQFVAFYLTAGVFSSFASHVYKTAFSMPGLSLGASGAIMGVISFVCTQYPETLLSIAFLPMWTFTAGSALKALMTMDTVGCIMGWKFMDHAAHLGGALFGIFWQSWGNSNIWQKREPIVKHWHNIRQPPRSN